MEALTLQARTARESVDNSQGAESVMKTRIAEVDDFLAPTYANWNRIAAGRIVGRRRDLTEAQKVEFMGLCKTGLDLKGELEIQQNETVQKKKTTHRVGSRVETTSQ